MAMLPYESLPAAERMPVYDGSRLTGYQPKGRPGTEIGGMFVSPGTRLTRPPAPAAPAAMTPEAALMEQFKMGQQQIQEKYAMQWEEANRSARFIGPAKHREMLQQIDTNARQELLRFNQDAQSKLVPLRQLDDMAQQGLIPNVDQIKARMVFGSDVAASMYPERPSVEAQYGTIDIYARRIESDLDQFRIQDEKGKRMSPWKMIRYGTSPYGLYKYLTSRKPDKKGLEVWDPSIITIDKEGKEDMGAFRPATDDEIKSYLLLLTEKQEVDKRKRDILAQPDVSQRTVQPGITGGSFADKVAESVKPTKQPAQKVIRQRNKRTRQERVSYDGGKTWQIVSG